MPLRQKAHDDSNSPKYQKLKIDELPKLHKGLTMHINLRMSLRQTKYSLKELYNINISHQQVANYCKPRLSVSNLSSITMTIALKT